MCFLRSNVGQNSSSNVDHCRTSGNKSKRTGQLVTVGNLSTMTDKLGGQTREQSSYALLLQGNPSKQNDGMGAIAARYAQCDKVSRRFIF